MRRRATAAVVALLGVPVVLASAGTALLNAQAARLRREFDAARGPEGVAQVHRSVVRSDAARGVHDAHGGPASHRSAPPDPHGTASPEAALAVIGDSWVAGTGPADPPALMARGLAALTGADVRLSACARPSARADEVADQVDRVLADPHQARAGELRIAVVSMGTGDVLHPVTGSISLGVLTSALTRLQREGYAVIVLCCPNLSSLPGMRNPLRTVVRRYSRVLAGSQWLAAVAAGALPLSTTRILSGTTRVGLLAPSGHHPSRLGSAQLAAAVLTALADRMDSPRASVPVPEAELKDSGSAAPPAPPPAPHSEDDDL